MQILQRRYLDYDAGLDILINLIYIKKNRNDKMKIFRTEEKYDELRLNKDAEFIKVDGRSYVVHVEDVNEYEKLQRHIQVAIEKDIEVYETSSIFRKLEICDSKIVCASFPVFMFSTSDKDKFDSLDLIIKNIMMNNNKNSLEDF